VLESQAAVQALAPDFARLRELDSGSITDLVVTAQANADSPADFVSRVFAPGVGIPEDPVTGSAYSTLAPYWAAKLGRTVLTAHQLSARGGELHCEVLETRVRVSGHAVLYSEGTVHLPEELA
jgi:PhzF family phenazine biosynthesis protein